MMTIDCRGEVITKTSKKHPSASDILRFGEVLDAGVGNA
jgi:hypothetical protein